MVNTCTVSVYNSTIRKFKRNHQDLKEMQSTLMYLFIMLLIQY